VEIINGDREAELIYYGIKQVVKLNDEKVLILDIGGGSNELLIANQEKIFWKKSYPLGVARLLANSNLRIPFQLRKSNLFPTIWRNIYRTFLMSLKNIRLLHWWASGSFETIMAMIRADDPDFESETSTLPEAADIDLANFENLYQKLINSTLKERKQMKGLESMRIEMIVVATLIVKFIIQKLKLRRLIQSNFALKEGVVYEMLN